MSQTETQDSKVSAFKDRVKAEWAGDETAAAWQKHYAAMREQMANVTAALVAAAQPKPGMAVLDIAAGTGDPSLTIARAVEPGGTVTSTDFNPAMLAALRHNAEAEGVTNLSTRAADAHELQFPDGTFDLVVSRFGVMFFGEVDRALGEMRRVLKPGGRLTLVVWGGPIPGSYFGTAALPFIKRMAEKPDPDGPGPMRFAEPGKLVRLVEAAGFSNVQESVQNVSAPYAGTPEQMLVDLMEIAAPFRNAVATLSESDRQDGEREVIEALHGLYTDGTVNVTAPIIVVTGDK